MGEMAPTWMGVPQSGIQSWGRDYSTGVGVMRQGFPGEATGRQKGTTRGSSEGGLEERNAR